MSMIQEQTIPLYEDIVNGYNTMTAGGSTGRESSDLRRARQSAFDRFRALGFPTIKNEDWKYTNITRFLKDEFALGAEGLAEAGVAGGGVDGVAGDFGAGGVAAGLLAAATIPGLDCYQVVLVNGVWNGAIKGGALPKGLQLLTVSAARQDATLSGYFERTEWGN